MSRWALCLGLALAACARTKEPVETAGVAPASSATATASATAPVDAAAPETASASDAAASTAASAAPSAPFDGQEFLPEALLLYRVAACGPSGEVPSRFDAAVVGKHCEELGRAYDDYKKGWVDVAKPYIAALRPKDLPPTVVYPFGGGDLVSALATFPDATSITTISLEPAGDVRPIDKLAPERLGRELATHRDHLERLFLKAHSRTDNLEKESKTDLPGEVVFDLAALVVHGFEPTGLRYFRIQPDGSLAYVTAEQIDAAKHKPQALHALFENMELRFRAVGDASAPVRIARHISFNLDDDHLKADPSLLAYLDAGASAAGAGKVAAMTKAATHLLWNSHFSKIRSWLADHVDWMISDSTGFPPRVAQAAGFTQETYGRFDGPAQFGTPGERDAADLKRLFASQPKRDLGFRYGYPDSGGHAHMIVTSRAHP
jgi:hypothetical protein